MWCSLNNEVYRWCILLGKKKGEGVVAGDNMRFKWKFFFELLDTNSLRRLVIDRVFLIGTNFGENIWQTHFKLTRLNLMELSLVEISV